MSVLGGLTGRFGTSHRFFSAAPQRVRGTRDLIGSDCKAWETVLSVASDVAVRFGYNRIETPIIEEYDLFSRSLGDTSDVVHKEMFRIADSTSTTAAASLSSLCLRPENTAGVARAFAAASLHHEIPQRLYYYGPMFRYERPQKGRYRQFTQFGAELIGTTHPSAELEVIQMAHDLLKKLKISDQVHLKINTLGDRSSRMLYKEALETHLKPNSARLSPDSQMRLERGSTLRILDSKDARDHEILSSAPSLSSYLSQSCTQRFHDVKQLLQEAEIPFEVDSRLVRGLDYYTETIFEFVVKDATGAQNAVIAGGRYDDLIGTIGGGQASPGIGWAAGVERLILLCPNDLTGNVPTNIVVSSADGSTLFGKSEQKARSIASQLRSNGFSVVTYPGMNLKKQLHKANTRKDTKAVIIVDKDSDLSGAERVDDIIVRNFITGKEIRTKLERVVDDLRQILSI